VQYGGKIRDDSNYRVFAKYQNIGDQPDLNGQNGEDGWHLLHGGFRADTKITSKDAFTMQGDLYTGSEGAVIIHSVLAPPNNFAEETITGLSGGSLLGRWTRTFSEGSDLELQVYFDRYSRAGPESNEKRDTVDFDFQHHFAWGERQDVLWGAGYRHTADEVAGTIDQAFIPANFSGELWNFFVQDQITLQPNRVSLYVGTKLENSFFSGYELEPSIRIAWTPTSRRTIWAAVSRAIRTPTRRGAGVDATLAALPGPKEVVLLGNGAIQPEHVIAYELGYRTQLNERLSVDLAAFLTPTPTWRVSSRNHPLSTIPRVRRS
jgi:iron complex outermembrane receptor protein